MRLATLFALLSPLGAVLLARPASAQYPGTSEVRLLVGGRSFDEEDWAPVEDQVSLGTEVSWRSDSPFGFELGLSGSTREDDTFVSGLGNVSFRGTFFEGYGGVRATFGESEVQPYVGAGLSWIDARAKASVPGSSSTETDSSFGLYVHGGVGVRLTERIRVGFDARALIGTDLTYSGVSADADYLQAAAFVGFDF